MLFALCLSAMSRLRQWCRYITDRLNVGTVRLMLLFNCWKFVIARLTSDLRA